jgi:hypothetical protein
MARVARWCPRCEAPMPLQSIPVLIQGRPTGSMVPAWICPCGLVSLDTGEGPDEATCPTCRNYCALCGRLTCHCGEH